MTNKTPHVLSTPQERQISQSEISQLKTQAATAKINEIDKNGPGITLTPPVDWDGETIDFISTDFNRLTGGDLRQVEKEFRATYHPEADAIFFLDTNYLLLLFAKINGVDVGFFNKISGANYLSLTEFYKLGVKESLGNS